MIHWRWPSRFTHPGRYDDTGVTSRFLQYVECVGSGNLRVFDVGSSEGTAISDMQELLKKYSIHIETTGIDPNKKVRKKAEKNLDEFIQGDIMDLTSSAEYDIVICSKMILFADAQIRSSIIEKCSEFLKPDGAMITDVDSYEISKIKNSLIMDVNNYLTILLSLKKGIKYCYRIWKQIQFEKSIRKIYLVIGRENVKLYSTEILKGWENLPKSEKASIKRRNRSRKFMAYLVRNPKRTRNNKSSIQYNSGHEMTVFSIRSKIRWYQKMRV